MVTPVLATLAYVLSPDRRQVLMLHRNKRPGDLHLGKYVGLGGKVERDEDVVTGVRREIKEESGLIAEELTLRGTVLWPGFGKHGEDWLGFVFRVEAYAGDLHEGPDEGTLEWVEVDAIRSVPMWASDHEWLPMVLDDDPRQFHGVMPYQDGEMVSWSYTRI
ncbi:MAG: 8-oxo-dGTP diphosphatase [Hamadaea sp.]|uniref:NUDIX hydrolase n=1 Tax=Hamadaea sp. TaxID=2024425 RepID=UPI0017ACE3D9|nr:8-oxo-dGTP diphosphatase [Hamadaea sp.]NUR72852.1 8-oxo-dGTP diphosphatase [Hamadaea sp.]NUT20619.1 8-oxo-dGTP diphosphatase [Hamadaea sp.]